MKEAHKPALTANMVMVTDANGQPTTSKNINATELNMLNNILTNVQTQLNAKAESSTVTAHTGDSDIHVTAAQKTAWTAKQAAITGAATTITGSNLTTNRALISNDSGKVAVSAVTSTELGYLDGVTSKVQTQLNAKAESSTLTSHTSNTTVHITSTERTTWNGKLATSAINKASTGYVKLSNGIIIQWGNSDGVVGASKVITFPTAFSSINSYTVTINPVSTDGVYAYGINRTSTTTFTVYSAGGAGNVSANWIAIGY